LVVGEAEILGQVKQAYETALAQRMTGKVTNVLFQRALHVGKLVRTQTGISAGQSSVASVAVGLAERIFGTLQDKSVLILGAGPIGLMFATLAKNLGCEVTVAGRRAARLEAARRLGANQAIDIGDGRGLAAKIREATKTHFDAVIEAVGHPNVWEAAVHLVRKGGVVNFFGGCPSGTSITLDTTLIHYSNLTLLASFHHTPHTIRRALAFIEAGVIRAADFVDGECPLTQLPELFRSMAAGNHALKTMIRVHE